MNHTETLIGASRRVNITGCSVTTNTFRTFPELLGKTHSTLDTPRL